MHAVIMSWQLKDSLKEENLGYNLGPYIAKVNFFKEQMDKILSRELMDKDPYHFRLKKNTMACIRKTACAKKMSIHRCFRSSH
jgi:hypothetical protein